MGSPACCLSGILSYIHEVYHQYQNGGNQSINVEVGPSRVLLSGEQSIALVGSNNVPESSLPNRHSKRLAVKGK